MTVRVFDCPTLGEVIHDPSLSLKNPPLKKIAGVSCECGDTHLAGEVNLRDEEAPDV